MKYGNCYVHAFYNTVGQGLNTTRKRQLERRMKEWWKYVTGVTGGTTFLGTCPW